VQRSVGLSVVGLDLANVALEATDTSQVACRRTPLLAPLHPILRAPCSVAVAVVRGGGGPNGPTAGCRAVGGEGGPVAAARRRGGGG
jgi:hypothetical protein